MLQSRPMQGGWWDIGPSTLAQWVGGIGTVGAVIVALFKDPIRARWNKPQLEVTCTKEVPETVRVSMTTWQGRWPEGGGGHWTGDGYYVRIRVKNRGRTRAEKIEVSAIKLARRGVDNRFADIPTTLPFNMRWSNGPPDAPVTVLDGISREMSAFCDIVSISNPANPFWRRPTDVPEGQTVGHLQLEFDLHDEWRLLTPGTYQLTLRIGGANVEPINRIIEFTHDGSWTQDDQAMRRDHLDVSIR
jgi:hypothetical protein